jgi:hypothetical protein
MAPPPLTRDSDSGTGAGSFPAAQAARDKIRERAASRQTVFFINALPSNINPDILFDNIPNYIVTVSSALVNRYVPFFHKFPASVSPKYGFFPEETGAPFDAIGIMQIITALRFRAGRSESPASNQ